VSPDQLTEYSNLLVVLFVKNGCDEITAQLKSLGITNCISIDEVLDGCNLLCEEEIHYAQ
jgi:hypothetical protein